MPLRWRLVAIYAVVLAVVIAGFSVALVLALRSTLVRGVAAEVDACARTIGAVIEFEGGAWAVEAKSGVDERFAGDGGLYYQVADEHGVVLLASPLARALSPEPVGNGERLWQTADRRLLEVTQTFTKAPEDEEPQRTATLRVTCGKDLAEVERVVTSVTSLLAWLGPLVLVCSLAGGLFLAGRALRPIQQIASTAAAIGEHDLARRIEVVGADELATLAATLNGTFDRLQQAFERQARFTADASHELRTPLAVVAGNAELVLSRNRSPEEQREMLQEILGASRQMQSTIEGLLMLARADHADAFRKEDVQLTELCEAAVRAEAKLAAEHRVELRCDAGANIFVRGDRRCLLQVLQNLIGNAVCHNRPGGHVVVRTRGVDSTVEIEVEDDGIGVPADALPHLGERFFRVDPSRTRATGGVGLGLSIVKAIVVAHGGRLHITSVEGKGTRVLVALPGSQAAV